jgi:hypothetical protein
MTRLTVMAAFLLLLCAAPAAAQTTSDGDWAAIALAAPIQDGPSPTLAAGAEQHRLGTALLVGGLNMNIAGAIGGFFSALEMATTYEDRCVSTACTYSQHPDWTALFATSLITSGVGLVLFFVGLGVDIHGRILRSAAGVSVALRPDGLALTF